MKYVLFPAVFFLAFFAQAQPGEKLRKGSSAKPLLTDSVVRVIKARTDSLAQALPVPDSAASMQPSYTFDPAPLVELQRERNRRDRQAALIRLAIGIGFGALLGVALWRRRKKNTSSGS